MRFRNPLPIPMPKFRAKSRRQFLSGASAAVAAAVALPTNAMQTPAGAPPGTPPAFGTAPPAGPEVSAATFAQAEKLVQVQMTPRERAEAAGSWRVSMAPLLE